LKSQVESYRKQIEEIESKRRKFLLLGVFGVLGLIALGVTYKILSNKISPLQDNLNKAKGQAAPLVELDKNMTTLISHLAELNGQLPFLNNAVGFLIADMDTIKRHLNTEKPQVKLFINSAMNRLKSLATDVA
jgi:hypothetical protein